MQIELLWLDLTQTQLSNTPTSGDSECFQTLNMVQMRAGERPRSAPGQVPGILHRWADRSFHAMSRHLMRIKYEWMEVEPWNTKSG